MAKYRKVPVIVDAVNIGVMKHQQKIDEDSRPDWVYLAIRRSYLEFTASGAQVRTLNGFVAASDEEWVVRGIKDELYPVAPDIFAGTFEPVEAGDSLARRLQTLDLIAEILDEHGMGGGPAARMDTAVALLRVLRPDLCDPVVGS